MSRPSAKRLNNLQAMWTLAICAPFVAWGVREISSSIQMKQRESPVNPKRQKWRSRDPFTRSLQPDARSVSFEGESGEAQQFHDEIKDKTVITTEGQKESSRRRVRPSLQPNTPSAGFGEEDSPPFVDNTKFSPQAGKLGKVEAPRFQAANLSSDGEHGGIDAFAEKASISSRQHEGLEPDVRSVSFEEENGEASILSGQYEGLIKTSSSSTSQGGDNGSVVIVVVLLFVIVLIVGTLHLKRVTSEEVGNDAPPQVNLAPDSNVRD